MKTLLFGFLALGSVYAQASDTKVNCTETEFSMSARNTQEIYQSLIKENEDAGFRKVVSTSSYMSRSREESRLPAITIHCVTSGK